MAEPEQPQMERIECEISRTLSAPNLQIKHEQAIQPENCVLTAFHAMGDANARSLPFDDPGQKKKKKARRKRLDWTVGMHTRFVLSVVHGKNIYNKPPR
jgi:hypothetical protein